MSKKASPSCQRKDLEVEGCTEDWLVLELLCRVDGDASGLVKDCSALVLLGVSGRVNFFP